jgi:hypothetical protein
MRDDDGLYVKTIEWVGPGPPVLFQHKDLGAAFFFWGIHL